MSNAHLRLLKYCRLMTIAMKLTINENCKKKNKGE